MAPVTSCTLLPPHILDIVPQLCSHASTWHSTAVLVGELGWEEKDIAPYCILLMRPA